MGSGSVLGSRLFTASIGAGDGEGEVGLVDFVDGDGLVVLRLVLFRLVRGLVVDLVDVSLVTVLVGVGLIDVDLVDFGLEAGLVVVAEEGAFLERRVVSPSIDLFLSIIYNYSMKVQKITKKQQAVLNFLEDFTEENGYSPSYREIMNGLGLSSVSAVAEHIDNMVSKGILKKVPGAARSLEVLDYKHEDTVEFFKMKMTECSEEDKKVLEKAGEILGLDLG